MTRALRVARVIALVIALVTGFGATAPAAAWDSVGHMMVAYVAYQGLTPQVKERANALIRLNPKHDDWVGWLPSGASAADRDTMLFMIAATWPDQIKRDPAYTSDGSHGGNRPDGSPDPSGNHGYDDMLLHKYWHFVDTPFSTDGTPLPKVPVPNAAERIPLFRGVLHSDAPDPLKSYDLVWLLHLVGDVHQPLHCANRVSRTSPDGDDGGNAVSITCAGCPSNLHAFWDDVAGAVGTDEGAVRMALAAARKLAAADPALAAKSSPKTWIAESLDAAKTRAYARPVRDGNGPFTLTRRYRRAALRLAKERIALAGARLANLLNANLR